MSCWHAAPAPASTPAITCMNYALHRAVVQHHDACTHHRCRNARPACRNKGVPQDLRWAADGSKICIAYDDGAVIVGGVDGARLWGKDLPLRSLSRLHWAPDTDSILFATATGECHSYDSIGNPISKLQLYCNEGYAGVQERGKGGWPHVG